MIVHVESNFVLELTLGQEHGSEARRILELAEQGEVELAIPWIALAEPFSTVKKRLQDRTRFRKQLESRLEDMRRSPALKGEVRFLEFVPPLLIRMNSDENDNLAREVERILDVATVLTINAAIFRQAVAYQSQYEFEPEDAFVYACVVANLTETESPGPHYFVTKDRGDFGDPGIADELRELNCEILLNFPDLVLLLEQPATG